MHDDEVITLHRNRWPQADTERIFNGEEPAPTEDSENAVTDVPPQFKQWLEDNAERSMQHYYMPYFIRDNHGYVPKVYRDAYGMRNAYSTFAEYEMAMKYNAQHADFSKEQLANIRELNKVLPVMQGQIMNFTKADSGNVNPLFDRSDEKYSKYCATGTLLPMTHKLAKKNVCKVGKTLQTKKDVG